MAQCKSCRHSSDLLSTHGLCPVCQKKPVRPVAAVEPREPWLCVIKQGENILAVECTSLTVGYIFTTYMGGSMSYDRIKWSVIYYGLEKDYVGPDFADIRRYSYAAVRSNVINGVLTNTSKDHANG